MRMDFRKTEKKSNVPITESKRRRSVMYELVSYILIVIILLCAFLIFLDIGCVPSESMEPQIKVNDMIIGNNLAYQKNSKRPCVKELLDFQEIPFFFIMDTFTSMIKNWMKVNICLMTLKPIVQTYSRFLKTVISF